MTNIEEIWFDIPQFKGRYQCSNLGRIKSLFRVHSYNGRIIEEKILKPIITAKGYCAINITFPKRKQFLVHRIVCEMFHPLIQGKNFVNHKDFNRANNHPENLEWCTQKENVEHYIMDQRGQGRILLNIYTGIYYFDASEAGATIGVSRNVIHNNLSPGKVKYKKSGNTTPFIYV